MKLALPAEGPDLDAKVGDRLGSSSYLLVVDLESKGFESIRTPKDPGSGSGMHVVALIIAKQSNVVLTGCSSPTADKYLSALAGIISTGPIYVWYPMLKDLREKGAKHFLIAVFLVNRAVKPFLLPVIISFFGWIYALVLTVLTVLTQTPQRQAT